MTPVTDRPCVFGMAPSEAAYLRLRETNRAAVILNTLPFDEALELYLKHG